MPLCTVADVKTAARVDPDLTEWDAEIPHLIASATDEIEQECNVPAGWFEQEPAPRGTHAARRACIAIAAKQLDDPVFDARQILAGPLLWPAKWYGDTAATFPPVAITPVGAIGTPAGWLSIGAGPLILTPSTVPPVPVGALLTGAGYLTTSGGSLALTA